ncbi:MAG: hypothetical protein KBA66_18435 [Leptospiraceae bacterium]|nr:hypothetical protein [Leptospiraceae bacterium]
MNKAIVLISLYFIYDFLKSQWISYSELPLNTSIESKLGIFGIMMGTFLLGSAILLYIFILEKYKYYLFVFLILLFSQSVNLFYILSNSDLEILPIQILLNIIRLTLIGFLYINYFISKKRGQIL